MLKIIVTGFGVGLALSVIAGPVFFSLIKTSVEKGFIAGAAMVAGVFLSDLGYILLSLLGVTRVELNPEIKFLLGTTGAVFLLLIGFYYLFKKTSSIPPNENITSKKHPAYFFKGFLMNTLNPFVLFFWVTVISMVKVGDAGAMRQTIPFYVTILTTLVSADLLKAWLASRLRHKLGENVILWMNRIAGLLMLFFALNLFLRVF